MPKFIKLKDEDGAEFAVNIEMITKIVPGADLSYEKVAFHNPEVRAHFKPLSHYISNAGFRFGPDGAAVRLAIPVPRQPPPLPPQIAPSTAALATSLQGSGVGSATRCTRLERTPPLLYARQAD